MPGIWDYVASAYAVDGDNNRINGNGDLRCPGCPLADGYAGLACIRGAHQQAQCVTFIQAGDVAAIWQAKNHAMIDGIPLGYEPFSALYLIDGDPEAHNPAIGSGVGDPDYTGPYIP